MQHDDLRARLLREAQISLHSLVKHDQIVERHHERARGCDGLLSLSLRRRRVFKVCGRNAALDPVLGEYVPQITANFKTQVTGREVDVVLPASKERKVPEMKRLDLVLHFQRGRAIAEFRWVRVCEQALRDHFQANRLQMELYSYEDTRSNTLIELQQKCSPLCAKRSASVY
jgi:hypothetical protein